MKVGFYAGSFDPFTIGHLHIVKVAIEQHHQGEVFVHSKLGEGSTFGFRIPIVPLEVEPEYPTGAISSSKSV